MKKQCAAVRCTSASFANALEAVFTPQGDQWRFFDGKSMLKLMCVCVAGRKILASWLDAVEMDLSLGKEALPVPLQIPPTTNLYTKLVTISKLIAFTYTNTVQLPIASEQYKLPPVLLSKQQRDEWCVRVRRGRQVKVYLAECSEKGWGVFAAQQIERGEFVAEYTGELISFREMQRRYRDCYDERALNYVLSLREHVARQGYAALRFDVVRTNVDATCNGNLSRFVNHSCSPNLSLKAVRMDLFVPRLMLFARKRIDVDEELAFDYGHGSRSADGKGLEEIKGGRPCRCGALECRRYLPYSIG